MEELTHEEELAMAQETEKHLMAIIEACKYLGWDIAIPNNGDDAPVNGLIVGTTEYVESVLDGKHETSKTVLASLDQG